MKLVIRGGSERTVPDEKLEEYLNMGYSEIDSKGNIIQKGRLKGQERISAELAKAEREAAALCLENENLRARLAKLESSFKCPHCDKTYQTQQRLDAHIAEKHGGS